MKPVVRRVVVMAIVFWSAFAKMGEGGTNALEQAILRAV
jgi:hypothetical protein